MEEQIISGQDYQAGDTFLFPHYLRKWVVKVKFANENGVEFEGPPGDEPNETAAW